MKNIADSVSLDESIYSSKKNSLDALCNQKEIIRFMNEYGLKREDMDDYWLELLNYAEDYPNCKNCQGLKYCPKKLVGYKRKLDYVDGNVIVVVEACEYQKMFEDEESVNSRIITNLPRRLLDVGQDTVLNLKRGLLVHFLEYLDSIQSAGLQEKGMFITGPSQTGKTVSLGYFAKRLARENLTVAFYNVPALMAQLKSSFNDDEENTSNIISRLKNVDVLILDDLGGENYSSWSRDEVLGTIIEERLLSQKPIFYSSVYDYDDLIEYYTSSKNKVERMKVQKLIEKIKNNCILVQM